MYGITAILGMFAIILLESGIWKALSFALLICAIVAIGYKDIVRVMGDKVDSKQTSDKKEKAEIEKEIEEIESGKHRKNV